MKQKIKFIFLTILFIFIAHYLAVFIHEYMHSLTAVLLGYKNNFLDINYGGKTFWNILLLINIDENVNYSYIFSHGVKWHAALIGFAGPGIANGAMYFGSLLLLNKIKYERNWLIFYFLFWFNFMNLANLFDYVPIRTFSTHGDIAHITQGLGISPYFIYAIFGYIVAIIIWYFFTNTLIRTFIILNFKTLTAQALFMSLCVLMLFGYFATPGFFNYGEISFFLSTTSYISIPGIIIACWPNREWVKRQLQKF